jgi:TolB protein
MRMANAQFDVAMTPDGRIVFPARDTVGTDIWIMNSDGTGRKQLTEDSSAERWPAVSPDGRYIAYVSIDLGKQNVWRMNLDGSGRMKLTDGDGESYPEFTPDGRFILFNSVPDGNLWQIPVEGGNPTKILGEKALRVSVAPDGKKYAHTGRKDGKRKLWVRSYPSGEILKEFDLKLRQASLPRLFWSNDGSSLIFETFDPTYIGNLFRQPMDGSEPVPITNFTSMQIFDFYILPSGETAFVRGSWKHDAVMLTKQN